MTLSLIPSVPKEFFLTFQARCLKGSTRVSHGCLKGVTRLLLGSFKGVPMVLKTLRGISPVIQGCFIGGSRMFVLVI